MSIRNGVFTIVAAFSLGAVCMPAHAQVRAGGSARASAGVPGGVAVPTQLLGGVNSGKARVGQQVLAKTLSPAQLADGSSLPSGSQLMGRLTEVKKLTGGSSGSSQLKMLFDQAKTPDGQVKKIASAVSGLGGSSTGDSDATSSPATQGGSGGGLLGGVVGGVTSTTGAVLGAVTSLPGVLLDGTGTLTGQGREVNLPAGTQVTVSVAAQQQ